jgi:hypothetical protein
LSDNPPLALDYTNPLATRDRGVLQMRSPVTQFSRAGATGDFYFCFNCWVHLPANLVVYWPPDPTPRCPNCETAGRAARSHCLHLVGHCVHFWILVPTEDVVVRQADSDLCPRMKKEYWILMEACRRDETRPQG